MKTSREPDDRIVDTGPKPRRGRSADTATPAASVRPGSLAEALFIGMAKAIAREQGIDLRPVTRQPDSTLGLGPALVVTPPVLQVIGPPVTEVRPPVLLLMPAPASTAEAGWDVAGGAVVQEGPFAEPHLPPLDEVQA